MKSFDIATKIFGIGSHDIYATFGPLQHSLVLHATIEAVTLGASILDLCGCTPRQQALSLRDQRATILYATPTQLELLISGYVAAG